MRTVFVLFDSLNRLALGAYGGSAIVTPNFDRFATRAVTFDKHYVGSLPCMPARRDMHTGRLNFMHRSWGPLEPFDDSFARILSQNGVYTHLISDHLHYFEDGGWGYATAFDSWDFVRGQEYDPMEALVSPPLDRYREKFDSRHYPLSNKQPATMTRHATDPRLWKKSRGAINRDFLTEETDFPTAKCFAAAFEFLDRNRAADDWFLQLECFDPHEPFVAPARFKAAYASGYEGKILDWPNYEKAANSPDEIAEIRGNYAALVAMCDEYFGKLLDYFDTAGLWEDTALVLTTDHGFLLAEHEWWGKNRMPYYEEISHIPLMIWHPEQTSQGARRGGLSQTPDLMPTFLDLHGCDIPESVTGRSLAPALKAEVDLHDTIILGMFGGPVCVTDGRHSYFRYPTDVNAPLNLYTLMPAHLSKPFDLTELRQSELVAPFNFTKGVPVLKVPMDAKNSQVGQDGLSLDDCETVLFDLKKDPRQDRPIADDLAEDWLMHRIIRHFIEHDAPREIYAHFGLKAPRVPTAEPGRRTAE
ncbi:sulfatase-like hydrolase/transferase [Roseobacter sp. HKCCD9010]|nr:MULTISPECIES: sulfatase [unclassified Roseobacter]MBF9052052.1 sulfatase-like hydrolase/transferase [Rhodobacterales bacterium HKCCD4356]NNV13976.1 sulfatase-like hydrolase/transferase [Roseobacter sp. HKCCD7357]NNV18217.1 sulfatase-like hydrolase/transferase [Roseobacter sp. HKCCD8768]NNV27677.1 sulfatase-like hydrolase/transferase [Roseobacter sp. HKCCD8192]NNV31989.1 sulfatase-like hydrolase/transferase [Roseobacter sp. HKCCD9061]